MDQTPPEQASTPEGAKDGPAAEPAQKPSAEPAPKPAAKPGPAERVKSWGDAATALFKAVLLALAIVIVGGVASVVVWRNQHSHVVTVDVTADTEKTLRALGTDVDLRLVLIDALNERLRGVQQIVAVQGLTFATEAAQPDAVSFKPFGLDLSAGDISRMVDLVLDRPARPSVRLALLCAPVPCTDASARAGTLVVNLSGPNGQRTASYAIPLGNFGMRRALRQSVRQTADLMLELSEPLIASVLFLNRALAQDVFSDQIRSDLIRAEAAAVIGRTSDETGCIADLVIGGSLVWRGERDEGVAAEIRAASAKNVTCQVHGLTNIVFFLTVMAECDGDPAYRRAAHEQVTRAVARLPSPRRGSIDDLVWFRIPAARLLARTMEVLEIAGITPDRPACPGALRADGGPEGIVAGQLRAILDDAIKMMPPDAPSLMHHQILSGLHSAMEIGVPRQDLAGRLSLAQAMTEAIRLYLAKDQHPQTLFLLRGKLAMEVVRVVLAVFDHGRDEQVRLARMLSADEAEARAHPEKILAATIFGNYSAAAVAFENAEATTALAPLVEPVSDVELLQQLGDVWLARGQDTAARATYARAVDRFIENGEPVEQVLKVSSTLARWASMRIAAGECRSKAPDQHQPDQHQPNQDQPDQEWEDSWARLGGPPHDVCQLLSADAPSGPPALLANVRQIVRDGVTACARFFRPASEQQQSIAVKMRGRFDRLDCLDSFVTRNAAAGSQLSAKAVDAEIMRALSGQR